MPVKPGNKKFVFLLRMFFFNFSFLVIPFQIETEFTNLKIHLFKIYSQGCALITSI